MSTQPASPPPDSLGGFEYELTDERCFQMFLAVAELQIRKVKEETVRQGSPHAALPLVLAIAGLLFAMALTWTWIMDSWVGLVLFVAAILVLLLLLFKTALYFWPAFRRGYVRSLVWLHTRRLSSRTIRWTFFADRLETESAQVKRSIPWTDLVRVEVLDDFWFLPVKSGVVLTVPVSALTSELQALIRDKANSTLR